MLEGYHHLTDRERCQALKQSGESNAGKQFGRVPAGRELTRNAGRRGYRFRQALATGRLRLEATVSHEWIYKHMWKNREAGGTLRRPAPRQEAQFACPGTGRPRLSVAWTYVRGSSRRSRGSGTGRATREPVTGVPCCRW